MPNRTLLDVADIDAGPVLPGNLGRTRSTRHHPDGARSGGGYTARRTAAYPDPRDEGADVHHHLQRRLLPHRMRA